LDEAALDLPEIDRGDERITDVVEDVDSPNAMLTGEARNLDLGDGSPEREVVERLSAAAISVVPDIGRPIIAGRGERDLGEVRRLDERLEGDRSPLIAVDENSAVAKVDVLGVAVGT